MDPSTSQCGRYSDLGGEGVRRAVADGGGEMPAGQNRGRASLAEETADAKGPTRELAKRVDMAGHRGRSFPSEGVSKGQRMQVEWGVQVWWRTGTLFFYKGTHCKV